MKVLLSVPVGELSGTITSEMVARHSGRIVHAFRNLGRSGFSRKRWQPVRSNVTDGSGSAMRSNDSTRYGFGFSAGGLLFPYYIGVLEELRYQGKMKDDTPVAGSSAGALIAAVHASGLDTSEIFDACKDLARDCRVRGTRYRLREVLKRFLTELLPDDIHIRASGRTFVGITQLIPRFGSNLVSTFESKEDLISALLTSSHVPLFMERSVVTSFRGKVCVDGGFTSFLPSPPGEDLQVVRICCFPSSQLGSIAYGADISPDSHKEAPYSVAQLLTWALSPADDTILNELFEQGREDTRLWAKSEEFN